MYCGSFWRPPRRPAAAGRLVSFASILILALGISAGPASAYPCKPPDPPPVATGVRTLANVQTQQKDCEPEPPARPVKRGNADPMSFIFFMGILLAIVFVPIALGRRENPLPE